VQTSGNDNPKNHRIDWLGIFRILLVQVLVLLALSAAFIRYLEWSSDQAFAEFARAISVPPAAKSEPLSSTPVQAVKGKATCAKKV
jgi:hypothetical protein